MKSYALHSGTSASFTRLVVCQELESEFRLGTAARNEKGASLSRSDSFSVFAIRESATSTRSRVPKLTRAALTLFAWRAALRESGRKKGYLGAHLLGVSRVSRAPVRFPFSVALFTFYDEPTSS